jgi:hypothetical protein
MRAGRVRPAEPDPVRCDPARPPRQSDADPAELRDPAAPSGFPEDEQKACRAQWAEVDALLKNARNAKP